MLELVQLQDGCYRLTLDYEVEGYKAHITFEFQKVESDSEPLEGGERIVINLK